MPGRDARVVATISGSLSTIVMSTSLMLELPGGATSDCRAAGEIVQRAAERMNRLIQDLPM